MEEKCVIFRGGRSKRRLMGNSLGMFISEIFMVKLEAGRGMWMTSKKTGSKIPSTQSTQYTLISNSPQGDEKGRTTIDKMEDIRGQSEIDSVLIKYCEYLAPI